MEEHSNTEETADRSHFEPIDVVRELWQGLGLPLDAVEHLALQGSGHGFRSSFKIGHLAHASIALSALGAALMDSLREEVDEMRKVTIPFDTACLNFNGARFYTLNGKAGERIGSHVGGLHATSDGYVRIHDGFPHHRDGALKLLGLPLDVTRQQVSERVRKWKKLELEEAAYRDGLVIYALRTYDEWDSLPQAQALPNFPIQLRKISNEGLPGLACRMGKANDRCLRGLRVLDLTRVVAGQVAGKTIASHGADVIWVTSPHLPDMPSLDRNLSRGKRTVQLDLNDANDRRTLRTLVKDCDVFLQGYRPESLAARGFDPHTLAKIRPGIVYASLSAFGPDGPWANRRGFDSLVQTVSGMNVSEALHYGESEPGRLCPTQVLDYGAGYLLAAGITAALYRQYHEGGSWEVHVSLAGTMKYLRSLGQLPGKTGFEWPAGPHSIDDVPVSCREDRETGFGWLRALKEAPVIEGAMPGFDHMPKPLGSDTAEWL